MGFWIMVFEAFLGLVFLILGVVRGKNDKRWFALYILGVACLAFAVWLAI
ncbi:hypothetical protein H3U98_00625 [Bifidobacterium sp. W8116]|uniref:Uncharacterized protein n=1 Tax=Bifidobacterium choladohabitans TaxID=2750947 RepID=A0ABS0QYN3_9BIFI|nr:hypothetical protein [Bifidobacterium choladohabitans]MBI0143294.1 hypothetical protein [Bifidobacterium choladohabitans]